MGAYKQHYPRHEVKQYNIIIDVLGGWSEDLEAKMKELVGEQTKQVLKRMQKVVLSHNLNIAPSFKICCNTEWTY